MDSYQYVLPVSAVVLESLVVLRLGARSMVVRYPYLTFFVSYTLARDLFMFPIHFYWPNWFATVYWQGETLSLFLRFLVIWEFFRGLFPARSNLHELAWKALLIVELVILPALLLLSWRQMSLHHAAYAHLSPAFEQYLSLAQVLLLLAPAVVARYYRVPLGRNMWGLGMGFGVYLCVCSVNFAGLQVSRSFLPYWQLLSPVTFICMILVWLWAFWDYMPSPVPDQPSNGCAKQKVTTNSADSDPHCWGGDKTQ